MAIFSKTVCSRAPLKTPFFTPHKEMDHAFICERTAYLPDDILLTLSPCVWQRQQQELFEHLQDLSHLHCCTPKLLSHNPRGLRRLLGRLTGTPKSTALPFLETLLDLLFSGNLPRLALLSEPRRLLAPSSWDGIPSNPTQHIHSLGWMVPQRVEIKEWLLTLAGAPLPKRKPRISFAEWYLLPDTVPHIMIPKPKDKKGDQSHVSLSPILSFILQPSTAKTSLRPQPSPQ